MDLSIVHVALYTSKFEETIAFYEQVFGAKSMGRFQAETEGTWLSLGESILEIFVGEDLGKGAFGHIAVGCDDVDALLQHALSHGATLVMEPKDIVMGLDDPFPARVAFIAGINGEEIELFQERCE